MVMEEEQEKRVGFFLRIKRFFQRFELKSEAPQNLLASGMWQIAGTLISAILAWILVVLVSREDIGLGAEGVGVLNTALAVYGIFMLLTLGMSKATSQVVSEHILDKRVAFEQSRNGIFVIIITGFIVGTGLVIWSFFVGNPFLFQNRMSSILFIIGIVLMITGFRDAFTSNLAAVGEYDDIAKGNFVFPLFQLLTGIIIIVLIKILNLPILSNTLIALVFIFGIIAQTLFLAKHFNNLWFNVEIFRFTKVDRRALTLARQGFYFSITDIIPVGVLGSIVVVLILTHAQMICPTTQAYEITGAFSIILGYALGGLIIVGFAWPMITAVAEAYGTGDSERIRFYLHLIVKLFFYLTFFILTIDIGLSRGILYLFHGPIYLTGVTDTWIPFILTIAAFAIAGFEYILCSVILGIGKGRVAAAYLGSIVLLVIGSVLLFLWLNLFPTILINASVGYIIGTLILLPLLPFLIKRILNEHIPMKIGLRSLSALACSIIIAALLFWPPLNLLPLTNIFNFILAAIILILCYSFLLVFFGAITAPDLLLLEKQAKEYNLEGVVRPILSIIRKIMNLSPFCHDKNP
ncbi:MAG: hypothetical protein ACTSRS_06930 [Candidatus Helarchaeota archaeon]